MTRQPRRKARTWKGWAVVNFNEMIFTFNTQGEAENTMWVRRDMGLQAKMISVTITERTRKRK